MIITNETNSSFIQIGAYSKVSITFQYTVDAHHDRCNMYLNIDIEDILNFWENKHNKIAWNTLQIKLNELYSYLKKKVFSSDIKQAIYGNHSCSDCQIILPKELLKIYHKEDYKDVDRRLNLSDNDDTYACPYLYSVLEMFMQRLVFCIYTLYKQIIWNHITSDNYQCCNLSHVKSELMGMIDSYEDEGFTQYSDDYIHKIGSTVFNEDLIPMFQELYELSCFNKLKLGEYGIYHEDVVSYTKQDFDDFNIIK